MCEQACDLNSKGSLLPIKYKLTYKLLIFCLFVVVVCCYCIEIFERSGQPKHCTVCVTSVLHFILASG